MSDGLGSLQQAFDRVPKRHAVFDRAIREHTGQWQLSSSVDVRDIVEAFARHGGFRTNNSEILIPIHGPDSAEITGQYVAYRPDDLIECLVYYDYSKGKLVRQDVDAFADAYPAWRIRFWGTDHAPPDRPSYVNGDGGVTIGDAGSPGQSVAAADGAAVTDGLFEELRSFVEREREGEREQTRQAYRSMAPTAFFETNDGIPEATAGGLTVDEYGEQIVHVRAALPDDESNPDAIDVPDRFGLYPGSELFVDRLDDGEGFPVEAELFDVSGRELDLGVYWDTSDAKPAAESSFETESSATFAVGPLLNPVPYDRQVSAIDAVASHDRKRELLTGGRDLSFGDANDVALGSTELNGSQRDAAVDALRADDVFCIHGPPGTGKTRTLTAVIRAAAAAGDRVLACAHSNQAVDNLLVGSSSADRADPRSLHADAEEGSLSLARVGRNSSNDVVASEYVDEDHWQADVVGATTSAAAEFPDDLFDLAVVDEATQATIPSTLIPVSKAKQTILAGDHKQLPPYRSSEHDDVETPEFSLFEHLLDVYGDGVSQTLRTQYRMNERIAAFPNEAFYGGSLTHGQRNRSWTIGSLDPLVAIDVAGEEKQTPMHSYYNEREAELVAEEVERLLEYGVLPEEIGIITPYSGQISKIRAALEQFSSARVKRKVKVDTIDSFQGGEREAIVVSFVRSNDDGNIGFLDFPVEGPRRLNVALTRARKRLALVGDWDTLAGDADGSSEPAGGAEYYEQLRRHLDRTGALRSE